MTSKEMKRRSMRCDHRTADDAMGWAQAVGNVAFQRLDDGRGRFCTCTWSWVCDALNSGIRLHVLADFDRDE
jgi:hypothetical protein